MPGVGRRADQVDVRTGGEGQSPRLCAGCEDQDVVGELGSVIGPNKTGRAIDRNDQGTEAEIAQLAPSSRVRQEERLAIVGL